MEIGLLTEKKLEEDAKKKIHDCQMEVIAANEIEASIDCN